MSNSQTSSNETTQRCSRLFKVTDFCTNRKPVCNFLLLNNADLHPVVRCFRVTAKYLLNYCFWRECLSTHFIWGEYYWIKIDRKWNFSFGRNRKSRRKEDTTFGRNRYYTESDYLLSAENRNQKFMRLITITTPPSIAVLGNNKKAYKFDKRSNRYNITCTASLTT